MVLFIIFGRAVKQCIRLCRLVPVRSFCIVDNISIESLLFRFTHRVVSKYASLLSLGLLLWQRFTG
jgi:hypothetical protein